MPPPPAKCSTDGCFPSYLQQSSSASAALSLLPFLLTFAVVATVAAQRLFPLLSGPAERHPASYPSKPSSQPARTPPAKRLAIITFSATIALAAVLALLILAELSNTLSPAARTLTGHVTVTALLILLIVLTPLLQLSSLITSAGWRFFERAHGPRRIAWLLALSGFALWLLAFWWIGHGLHPATATTTISTPPSLRNQCLERIGVIGISLMAILSGFASISAPWQLFVVRHRPISAVQVERKEAGLAATRAMRDSTLARLRSLQRKMSDAPEGGFVSKVLGSLRPASPETQERRTLQRELDGLQTMESALAASHAALAARRAAQQQARTPLGRCKGMASTLFSIYCIYRLLSTLLFLLLPRTSTSTSTSPSTTSTTSTNDPLTTSLTHLAHHLFPSLTPATWAPQISLLLSSTLLLASGTQAQATLHLLTRLTPAHGPPPAHAHLAHLLGQVSAAYVVSAALLLAGKLPRGGVWGAQMMEGERVQARFDVWYVGAAAVTLVLLCVGRLGGRWWGKAGEEEEDEEDEAGGEVELGLGKRA
ncbi:MAG: hypothetical protein M1829_003061 [Trizodia sp. TS-e1964]|nr:MAG: hypothetical protein M1829_003061 [Trizodia sp. TS-e1964]